MFPLYMHVLIHIYTYISTHLLPNPILRPGTVDGPLLKCVYDMFIVPSSVHFGPSGYHETRHLALISLKVSTFVREQPRRAWMLAGISTPRTPGMETDFLSLLVSLEKAYRDEVCVIYIYIYIHTITYTHICIL